MVSADNASGRERKLQAHGHAQIFGWIGTFILGIGFYSLSKMGAGFLLTLIANAALTFFFAMRGQGPALPHGINQQVLILAIWGFLVPAIWGASRHALTVGFVSTMVFAIGQRVLPAFCGMKVLFSKQLMLASLLLLTLVCAVRVVAEIPAYEGIARGAWYFPPVSGEQRPECYMIRQAR